LSHGSFLLAINDLDLLTIILIYSGALMCVKLNPYLEKVISRKIEF